MQFKLLPNYQPNTARRLSQPPASFGSFLRCFCVWALVPLTERKELLSEQILLDIVCSVAVPRVVDLMYLPVNGYELIPCSRHKAFLQDYFKHL